MPVESLGLSATEGLALGLSTGASCLGWCLPALGPYVATRSEGGGQGLRAVLVFNAGRLGGYLVVFAVSLAVGATIAEAPWIRALSAVALFALGVLMLLHAARVNFGGWSLCRSTRFGELMDRFPGVAGLLVGLSPCPPLLLAAAVVAGRGLAQGLLFALAFVAATSLFLLPLAVLGHPRARPMFAGVAAIAALLAGPWFIVHGVLLLL